jgi:uncharacterized protein (DUF1778 family)
MPKTADPNHDRSLEREAVTLSAADWKVLYDALISPPAPNAALRKAFAKYKKAAG